MLQFLLDLIFPKECLGCQTQGTYLCQDCKAILEIFGFHQKQKFGPLDDLYFATTYEKPLIKKLIFAFKYEGTKELKKDLANLILDHFQLLDNKPSFLKDKKDYLILPIPLSQKKLKLRGFNQAKELAKELSQSLKIPLFSDVLIKIKENLPQVKLSEKERQENVKGVFLVKNPEKIFQKKILLVDDVFTTGATLKEAARVLKESGAKKVIGIVIARAKPGEDRI